MASLTWAEAVKPKMERRPTKAPAVRPKNSEDAEYYKESIEKLNRSGDKEIERKSFRKK